MTKACGKCGSTDFTPAGTCRPCKKAWNDRYNAKRSGGGTLKTRAKNNAAPASVSEAPAGVVLQIDQGYGVKAWIDAPYLFLEQDDGEGKTDAICLSRAEFRALIANFGGFAK